VLSSPQVRVKRNDNETINPSVILMAPFQQYPSSLSVTTMLQQEELRFISPHLCHRKFYIKFKILYTIMLLLVLYRRVTCSRTTTQEHGWEQNFRWNVLVRKDNYTAAASECTFCSVVVIPGKALRNAWNKHHPEDRGSTFTRNVYNHIPDHTVSQSTKPQSK
jgi:hypothetical protein